MRKNLSTAFLFREEVALGWTLKEESRSLGPAVAVIEKRELFSSRSALSDFASVLAGAVGERRGLSGEAVMEKECLFLCVEGNSSLVGEAREGLSGPVIAAVVEIERLWGSVVAIVGAEEGAGVRRGYDSNVVDVGVCR